MLANPQPVIPMKIVHFHVHAWHKGPSVIPAKAGIHGLSFEIPSIPGKSRQICTLMRIPTHPLRGIAARQP